MSEILEAAMVICFGLSWPISIRKAYLARTTRGKSLAFLILITVGYVCGISAKLLAGNITYVFFFYVLNLCMLLTELALYARNLRLDRQRAEEPAA